MTKQSEIDALLDLLERVMESAAKKHLPPSVRFRIEQELEKKR